MAETLCQKRALETFKLDPAKWGGETDLGSISNKQFGQITHPEFQIIDISFSCHIF